MPEVELIGLHRLNVGGKVYRERREDAGGLRRRVRAAEQPALQGHRPRYARGARLPRRRSTGRPARRCSTRSSTPTTGSTSTTTRASIARASRRVDALASILGYPISKEERDAALNAVEKAPQAPKQVDTEEIKAAAAASHDKRAAACIRRRRRKPPRRRSRRRRTEGHCLMLLASVADIRSKLGFDDMTDINFAITMALDAAESQLAGRLKTEFDQGTFVDTFYVREPPYRDGPAFETEFRLRRGLVASLTSVVYAARSAAFRPRASTTDVTATVQLHPDKGVVKDFMTPYCRQVRPDHLRRRLRRRPEQRRELPDQFRAGLAAAGRKTATLIGLADSPALSEAQIKLDKKVLGAQYDVADLPPSPLRPHVGAAAVRRAMADRLHDRVRFPDAALQRRRGRPAGVLRRR